MGELRINLTNFITVGLLAFAFLFIARRLAPAVGLGGIVSQV